MMKICIVGGGNMGTAMAVEFAAKNHIVNIFTSKPEKWSKEIISVDKNITEISRATLNLVTNNFEEASESADYIFVTLPSNVQGDFAKKISQFVNENMTFIMIPGFGGSEFLMQPVIEKGAKIFGFQRVPYIARIKEYGHSVWYDKKFSINMAAFNEINFDFVIKDMEILFEIPCKSLKNYLCVTFTPSNPVLHTSRLYTMFKNFKTPLKENPLFYATWTDEASEILFALDEEVQKICKALPEFDLTEVLSLKKYYESDTPQALTKKLRSIPSLSQIYSPMIQNESGWYPDFNNRYFKCDFGYGLDILLQFAKILKLNTPTIEKVMDWYNLQVEDENNRLSLENYGLNSKSDILNFYLSEGR